MQTCVGLLQQNDRNGLVLLDQPDPLLGREVFVAARDLNGAPFGMKVVCALLQPVTAPAAKPPRAKIIEVLGDPNRPDVAVLAIIRQHGLADRFPEQVLAEAAVYGPDPDPAVIEAEIARGRLDLRGQRILTMDGEDAKDLDDAISIESLPNGRYHLGVHIADVAHYVADRSELDLEARRRGTSVYLADRVIPMLPPRLSNGICSLNPLRDRLALSVFLTINPDGETETGEIAETVIRSQARTSYTEVRQALESQTAPEGRYPGFLNDLQKMRQLARILEQKRLKQGSIDFEFPETHVELDSSGHPIDIYPYPITFANGIIEEFMIAANEYIARQFFFLKAPFLYRVHELPDPDKLRRFIRMAAIFGIRIKTRGAVRPGTLAQALEQVKHEPFGLTLSQLMLRSLAKARYSELNLGHFGLALDYYCHFTSPIRRYPDLYIHRIIKAQLHGKMNRKRWQAEVAGIAEHSSLAERTAMQAERDSVDQKAAEYLQDRLGEQYRGIISGFNPAGIFVQLENTVEGMVPFRTLPGYWAYDEERLRANCAASGQAFNIGDAVTVQVARVDTVRRRIDFELLAHREKAVGEEKPTPRTRKSRGRKQRHGK